MLATAEWVHWYGHHPATLRHRYANPSRARSRLGTRPPPPRTITTGNHRHQINQPPQNPGLDTVWTERLSGSRCWRCARRSPGSARPGRPTCTPGQGPAAPTPPPRGSAAPWAQPGRSCPVSTPGGSGCRRSAAGAPHRGTPGTWARRRPTSLPLRPAGSAEGVLEPDRRAALDQRALGCEVLAHSGQSQNLQAQQGRQVRAGEGSLRHVETSQLSCVAVPIIGGPRPLPGVTTRPPHLCTSIGFSYHTLKREEPLNEGSLKQENKHCPKNIQQSRPDRTHPLTPQHVT